MYKTKLLGILLTLFSIGFISCSEDDDPQMPRYGNIVIEPEQNVYHVGDMITCSIEEIQLGDESLKKSTYWWYASWWFNDPNLTADFQEFDSNMTCKSSSITLSKAGEITLYFFGRLDYPNFDFRKIEIAKTITVLE